jgi:hypothetical protein
MTGSSGVSGNRMGQKRGEIRVSAAVCSIGAKLVAAASASDMYFDDAGGRASPSSHRPFQG